MSIFLSDIIWKEKTVFVRKDDYRHGYYFVKDGKTYPADSNNGFIVTEKEFFSATGVKCEITVKAQREISVEKLFLRTGIDCYMDEFPKWNDLFFPTFLRCEQTHFIGYVSSPSGHILAFASPQPFESWSIDYNRAQYGDENHVGHRIYSFCFHLIDRTKNMANGGEGKTFFAGETLTFLLEWKLLSNLDQVYPFFASVTGAPVITCDKWTYEVGEIPQIKSNSEIEITSPNGNLYQMDTPLLEKGIYKIVAKGKGKVSTANIFVRYDFNDYLAFAGKKAFEYPQRPSTHAETYYGYFSAFHYARLSGDKQFLQRTVHDFNHFLSVMLTSDEKTLVDTALPKRVQNISTIISILCVAYKATNDIIYIKKAINLAHALMGEQAKSGEYLGWGTSHYTCVIYPAKSMLELYETLENLSEFSLERQEVLRSAQSAIADLAVCMDNIHTEGQQTFEDGMISCAALQLGKYALIDENVKERYRDCAIQLMRKHQCLEQRLVPDCRMRGATLRFWESMYDVLVNKNMINSPHGWTSWKTYATYYLYLLTNDVKYLQDTFDTLGACLQCYDIANDQLNWAFIVDPVIKANLFSYENGCVLKPEVFGECYLPMISDKWLSDKNTVCYGYAFPDIGITYGIYKGGCCDNDVHEHIKCMEEVGFNIYVHEIAPESFVSYNCEYKNGKLNVRGKYYKKLYFYSLDEKQIVLAEKVIFIKKGMNVFDL